MRWLFALTIFLFSSSVVMAQNPNIAIYSSQYREYLDQYRLQYDKLAVSLQQYARLKTLASQEEAVQTMRDFLLIRTDVVTTHFSLLDAELADRTTLSPDWVATATVRVATNQEALRQHRSRSDIAVDRIKADQEAVWFGAQQKEFFYTADRMQALIGMGKTQEAIDALKRVKGKVDAWIESTPMSETVRVEKRRGSDELGRAIATADADLTAAMDMYLRTAQTNSTAQIYPQIQTMIISAYTALTRGVGYAQELTR